MQQRQAPDAGRRSAIAEQHRKDDVRGKDADDGERRPKPADTEREIHHCADDADVDGEDQKELRYITLDPADSESLGTQTPELFITDIDVLPAEGAGVGDAVEYHSAMRAFHLLFPCVQAAPERAFSRTFPPIYSISFRQKMSYGYCITPLFPCQHR